MCFKLALPSLVAALVVVEVVLRAAAAAAGTLLQLLTCSRASFFPRSRFPLRLRLRLRGVLRLMEP